MSSAAVVIGAIRVKMPTSNANQNFAFSIVSLEEGLFLVIKVFLSVQNDRKLCCISLVVLSLYTFAKN